MPPASTRTRTTPAEWDKLRRSFRDSVMLDIPLSSLAQNIDGCAWDLDKPDEKPATYIELTHAEVVERFASRGLPVALLDKLADILRGTLSFDESFGAMVEIAGKAETDPVLRNLERLGIPADFPVQLCALSPVTLSFCQREGLDTLGKFLEFSRFALAKVSIGGEYRELVNALSHIDEATLARLLPFRPKSTGLHLVEALGLLVRTLPLEERVNLAREPASASPELLAQVMQRMDHFADSARRLQSALEGGTPAARLVVSLDDLSQEAAVAALLERLLLPPPPAPSVPEPVNPPGLLQRIFGRRRS